MGVKIRVRCPTCGDAELDPSELGLLVDHDGPGASCYAFDCSTCGSRIRKPANRRVMRLLVTAGVRELGVAKPPVADGGWQPTRSAPRPFQPDDLIDFHQLLASDDWFDRLMAVEQNHVANILAKLGVADRAQAIVEAREAGLGGDRGRDGSR